MQGKELHDFLFKLYDYADSVADEIKPGNSENANLFLTLVFIESYFDRAGRRDIYAAAEQATAAGVDARESLKQAHLRIDSLRSRMTSLLNEYEFDEILNATSNRLSYDWHKHKDKIK